MVGTDGQHLPLRMCSVLSRQCCQIGHSEVRGCIRQLNRSPRSPNCNILLKAFATCFSSSQNHPPTERVNESGFE
ncbi:hypothetical protein TNCV_740661 [Trichonephila clavipes]|nr:hypothetical protein TNCV_740661 [Trichonephila clavipes]